MDEDKTGAQPSRRTFLDAAMKAGMVAGAGAMAVPAALYLLPARERGPQDLVVKAGPAEGFEPGTARFLQADGRPIVVLSLGGERFRAFSAICTHLGCVVQWDPANRRILCPCHAGFFGTDGRVISGPPPRALPEYEVVRVGGELHVKL